MNSSDATRGRSGDGRGRSGDGRGRSGVGRGRSGNGRGRSGVGRGRSGVGRGRSGNGRGRSRSLSRYDVLLAAIPLAFGVALLAGTLLPVRPRTALSVAGVVAALVLADGLFLNPPGAAGRAPE